MASIGKIARRTFLFGSLAIAGGVAVGVYAVRRPAPNPLKPGDGETALNAFVMIDQTGVTLVAPRAEMGQGTQTTWAALLAEEMDLDWQDIRVIHGPAAKAYFNTAILSEALPNKGYDASGFQHSLAEALGQVGKLFDMQVTGGSTAMKDGYERMRATGAAAREMLKEAAAKRLGIKARDLRTEGGAVIAPDGTTLPYTDLAAEATDIKPRKVELRPRQDWTLLGTTLPRIDMVGKSTGTAQYGIDTRLPGMRFAAVRMAPRGGTLAGLRDREALKRPGVEKVVNLGEGYAVVATNTWLAQQALDAVEADWGAAPDYPADTEGLMQAIDAAFEGKPDSTMRDDGDADAMPDGATEVSADYAVPFLAHATMEPLNATAFLDGGTLRIWTGNQAPSFVAKHCAAEAGIDVENVDLVTTWMGGGFGRRGEVDFAVLATRVAKAVPGTPVNMTWSREEDMTHDFYRPAGLARMRGAVRDGVPVLLDARLASPSITVQAMDRWLGFTPAGPDRAIVDGVFNQPYGIPNYRVRGYRADIAPPLGFWRSVGNSMNGFFMESFVDEMARAAGSDPMQMRKRMARDEWEPALNVLEAVEEMSDWANKPAGTGRGLAFCYSFGTPVAMVIDVVDQDGAIRLTNAWIAADPGVALDPGNIEAQLTGGMAYGLSAAMNEEITFAGHRAEQKNFPDYPPLRIQQMPQVAVRILETQEHIGGIGEVGTPPAAPALANAIFDLTGQRIRSLPLRKSVDFFV